jgi:uncharacterized membrane protein
MVTVPFLLIICLQGLQKMTKPESSQPKKYSVLFLLLVIMAVNIFLMFSMTIIGKRGGI